MLFRRILVFVAGAVVTATAHGAFVDGYCYLEGQTNHCLSTAEITGGITPHLDYTNSAGYYRFELVAAPDTHHFRWAHPGFVTQIHPYYVPFGGVTLPPVTLESKLLCNPESWRFYPYTIPDTTIILPYDEGKHDPTSTYRIEWWYVNFHLTAEDGKQYAGIVSFFKPPVVGLPGMVLFSVVDLELGLMYSDAKYPLITDANDQWLDLAFGVPPQDKWWNRQCEGELMPFEYHLSVSWADEGVNWLELDMGCMKPPMAIGGDGFVEFGDVGWSYYYSHPRTDVVGTLHLQGFPALGKHVEGTAWIDHQWADFPTQDVTWEWFSIQLDDLRDILVADVWINDVQENFSGGLNYYDENCAQEVLHGYTITPLRCWYDTEHDTTYSTQWRVEEPTRQIDLIITAVYEHQVMETTGEIIGANFWEGACTVSGTIEGQPVEGTAFAELTHSWEGLPEACCFEGESCRYLPPELCTDQGGNPQGPGTDCDNTDCPQACCLTDDSCEFLLPGDCTALGGEPQGDGTYCEGEQACCLWGGECVMLAPICCYYREGFPQGPGSECEPYNPCNCACCPTSPFGDGSLGDHVVHSGTNLILNSDANYRNLKIKEGGTVYTAGHTLRVCNTLLNEGTIRAPYSGGEGGEGGEGGLGANPEQTSVPAGCGERGTTCTPGQDGSPGTGRGGDGGCGGGGGGGAKNLGRDADGGNGGAGGAGGNGGGNLLLYAFRLDNRGVIHADGQDGFDGADAPAGDSTYHAGYEHCGAEYYGPPDWPLHDVEGGGGGGGSGGDGGNGGIVEVYYAQLVNSSTIRADRGSGGNGGFGGSKGGCDAHIDLAGSKQNGCADGCAHSTWGHGGRGEYRVGYCSEDGEDGVDGSHGEEGHVNLNVVVFDDCNDNGCPDECDIYRGVSQDCQPNQVPDECDIAAGTS
ncbi:MAG: hypothetical protein KAV82_15320, partial [Phycisphaerae bacterium]|nr:hypothetical protein [Phycisphaerae bacterium]